MGRDSRDSTVAALRLTHLYEGAVHRDYRPGWKADRRFGRGADPLPYAGRVLTEDGVAAAMASALDSRLTLGPEGERFYHRPADRGQVRRDLQAATGVKQLEKLPRVVRARREDWHVVRQALGDLERFFACAPLTNATGWRPEGRLRQRIRARVHSPGGWTRRRFVSVVKA